MTARKSKPAIAASSPEPLSDVVRHAIREDAVARKVRVAMHVSGGQPEQAYVFDFAADGSGKASCDLRCNLSRRSGRKRTRSLDSRRFRTLLRAVDKSGVLRRPAAAPRFLPDTVVGRLEISSGDATHRIYFAADPDQASVQKQVPSAALQRVIDAVYAEGAKLLGVRSVKP